VATNTTKLALVKPDGADLVDIAVLNSNADKIDSAVGAFICTSTTRPATPWDGQVIFEKDTLNQRIWDTTTTTWIQVAGTPVGAVVTVATLAAPTGWLLCDGSVYANTTYPDLAAALGNTYGGTSGTSFAVPDLRGRVVVGKAASGTFASVNAAGGAESVTLTAAQSGVPAHSHGVNDPGHQHFMTNARSGFGAGNYAAVGSSDLVAANSSSGITSTGISINNNSAANASQAHTNLQPYRVMNYAIKF